MAARERRVERLSHDDRGFRDRQGRHLIQGHRRPVRLDLNRVEQVGRCAPGAHAAEFAPDVIDGGIHAPLDLGVQALDVIDVHHLLRGASPPSFDNAQDAPSSCRGARPLRAHSRGPIAPRPFARAHCTAFVRCSPASFWLLTSDSIRRGRSHAHPCPYGLAHDDTPEVARALQVEHDDGELVVHAERDRGRVHHLEAAVDHFQI